MTSLRTAAVQFLDIRTPVTVRQVGAQVGNPMGSTRVTMERLDQTFAETFSGSLLPSSVKGSAWLRLASDGHYWFQGHVHENGFLSHSWSFAAGPHVVDENKKAFVAVATGRVTDSESSDDFSISGHDPRIAALWDQIRYAPVTFRLEVTANFRELAEKVGNVILTAVGITGIIAGLNVLGHAKSVCIQDEHGHPVCHTRKE
ncbi:hypothetical protein ACTMSW_18125 [Micromonospora sp. BQ11]|uniref:hypothetical protein n=1 Tax=Micromonospora sp. BQ11 TaxID=3452212 RepID=UPI003F8AF14C